MSVQMTTNVISGFATPRTRATIALFASAVLFVFAATVGRTAEIATPNDTARTIAGLPPSAGSPLTPLTQNKGWQQHARAFNHSFEYIERGQLSKIRAWSRANLTAPKPVLFYMFSGPDFLYANAFFPSASTYVLSGLESVGKIPDLLKLTPVAMTRSLSGLRHSLRSVLSSSFFITSYMGHDLHASRLTGVLPVLYVFLASSGNTIQDVTLVSLDNRGEVITAEAPDGKKTTRGVKISFLTGDGQTRTLYYFTTNLADDGFKDSAFSQFCEKLNEGDSFVKSASYLLHWNNFSQVRKFLLDHSATIVQDDTGIPVGLYDLSRWQVRPFGNYVAPIPVFSNMYQPKMRALFRTSNPNPIDFGVGYRWRPSQSSLLVAQKKETTAKQ
jgi:hypothetical protein